MKLEIKVTKDILEKSKMCSYYEDGVQMYKGLMNGTNCAVALAVRDIFPAAAVSPGFIYPFGTQHAYDIAVIYLPKNASNYIGKFDKTPPNKRPLLPELTFEIDIPDEVIEKINIDEIRPLLENHPTLKLV